jgi:hypothetical protein
MMKTTPIASVIIILSMFALSCSGISVSDKGSSSQLLRNYDGAIGDSARVGMTITIKAL